MSLRLATKTEFEAEARVRRPDLVGGFLEADAFLIDEGTLMSVRLVPEKRMIWISGLLGKGLGPWREIRRWGLSNGYDWVGFKVQKSGGLHSSLIKYLKAKLMAETLSGREYCAPLRAR